MIDLTKCEKKVFSQNGEDGVIEAIFNAIGVTNKFFVEFGVDDGNECCTRCLMAKGFSGVWFDSRHQTDLIHRALVTPENVISLFESQKVPEWFDILSVDIDGNDIYVLRTILEKYKPRVIVVEYNSSLGPSDEKITPYKTGVFEGTTHFGSSISAFFRLGRLFGYSLVHADQLGVNLFFVRDTEAVEQFQNVNNVKAIFRPPRYVVVPGSFGHRPDPQNKPFLSFEEFMGPQSVKWWELLILCTYKCNLACGNCASGISKFAHGDCDISLEQIDRMLQQLVTANWKLNRVFLTGGEPTLYPHLVEALKLLLGYQDRLKYQIFMQSNGVNVTPELQKAVLSTAGNWRVCDCCDLSLADPAWNYVIDSQKFIQIPAHKTMYVAPMDVPELAGHDFSKGCGILYDCPIAVNKHGFYVCSMGATIDKVLGLDLGAKNIQDLPAKKNEQLKHFCKYCGEYKFYTGLPFKESTEWLMSPTWVELKKKYDAAPPTLTPF